MATNVTNHKCPACTGPLHFAGESGRLECEYCGSTYDVSYIEDLYSEKEQAAAEEFHESADGSWKEQTREVFGDEVVCYSCPSCGAELICDENTAATQCPYCGNPTIVPAKLSGVLKPDYVIPFKLSKDDAVAALKNFYKKKLFLPRAFSKDNKIAEVQGVYVPFWLFSGTAEADVTFQATRVHTHTAGKQRITVTNHFRVRRAGTVTFDRIPVDACKKMPDEHMDSIEPFDYRELKPFSTAYLPGFLADKFDVDAQTCSERADSRAIQTAYDTMAASAVGYTTCVPIHKNIRVKRGEVSYAMLPVWMLGTTWKGKNYLFAMNGQTGKLVGSLPVSKGKFAAWFAGIAVVLGVVLGFILL
ncbi:MAG: hypothetical protein IJP23_01385 [Oscillospiraceae bacterium]|nr:hypothetical protein [Oscillospiraceae bacterium]